MINSNIPTYQAGDQEIVVVMLDNVFIDNLLYKKGRKYKIPYWIAKELSKIGYCVYQIKPEDWFKENIK